MVNKKLILAGILALAALVVIQPMPAWAMVKTGAPACNFSVGGEVSPSGRILPNVVYNPPALGGWLEDKPGGSFSFNEGNTTLQDTDFRNQKATRVFPLPSLEFSDARMADLSFKCCVFAPIKAQDRLITSLPVFLVHFDVVNRRRTAATIKFNFSGGGQFVNGTGTITIPAHATGACRFFWVVTYDTNAYYANEFRNETDLAAYVGDHFDELEAFTRQFSDSLPHTGHADIDEYLRWYMTAGMILTRQQKNGDALTLGYTELNQRDNFWTSWLHLVLFTGLDQRFIEESAASQLPNGRLPMVILPNDFGSPDDQLDMSEYFVLHVLRYYDFTRDGAELRKLWGNVTRAIDFLNSRDFNQDGLLASPGSTFWIDWKDIPGVTNRRYGPHYELLWLAVLKQAAEHATIVGDTAAHTKYQNLYDRAFARINLPVGQGGLWNGNYYVNVWNDGRPDRHVLEDQVVGILFGVVDANKAGRIFAALEGNRSRWGFRETYPYYDNLGYAPGDYHNGGVWPFLNFVDAFARMKTGRVADGLRVIRTMAKADLEWTGEYNPHEYLGGNDGRGHRYFQGWDADLFGVVYFGLKGLKPPPAATASTVFQPRSER